MSSPKPFSEVLQEWAEAFMHRSFGDFKHFMDESGLSPSMAGTLMRLYHQGCGVSNIGEHLGITNAAASQMVDRLVQMGLVERAEDAHDRRMKQITLTPQGRALVERGIEARRHWMEDLTNTLTAEQRELIVRALMVLTEAARKLEDGEGGRCIKQNTKKGLLL